VPWSNERSGTDAKGLIAALYNRAEGLPGLCQACKLCNCRATIPPPPFSNVYPAEINRTHPPATKPLCAPYSKTVISVLLLLRQDSRACPPLVAHRISYAPTTILDHGWDHYDRGIRNMCDHYRHCDYSPRTSSMAYLARTTSSSW
jgi:hypothetical protein